MGSSPYVGALRATTSLWANHSNETRPFYSQAAHCGALVKENKCVSVSSYTFHDAYRPANIFVHGLEREGATPC